MLKRRLEGEMTLYLLILSRSQVELVADEGCSVPALNVQGQPRATSNHTAPSTHCTYSI